MCGILGGIYPQSSCFPNFKEGLESILHRGPDSGKLITENFKGFTVALGHRRLSIIDLSEGANQPFYYKNYIIIFNGEIYNYKEIKSQLIDLGHHFKTSSDTEVIIHSFEEWGKNCVEKFHGMFAFCIYNKETSETIIFRDRFGVKPLYYATKNGGLFFASELKALLKLNVFSKEIDNDAVMDFFSYGYISEPRSIFSEIKKLPAGHILEWCTESKEIKLSTYWNLKTKFLGNKFQGNFNDAKDALKPILKKAINYRMVADVPVGIFLSGGFDSSLVTSIIAENGASNINTFSIGFEQKEFNEAQYARQVADILGTKHHEYIFTEADCQALIPKICFYYDEPFSDVSMFPTTFLSQFAKQEVTVALSADGGDEIFAGYSIYERVLKNIDKFKKYKGNNLIHYGLSLSSKLLPNSKERLKYNLKNLSKNLKDFRAVNFLEQMSRRTDSDILAKLLPKSNKNFKSHFNNSAEETIDFSDLDSMLYTDMKGYMSNNILVKVDRASMAASLESREPLLDQEIVSFAASLPDEYKYGNGSLKRILKEITYDYLPKELMDRPKAGFTMPLFLWLQNDLKDFASHYLSSEISSKYGILEPKMVDKIRKGFFSSKPIYQDLAWQIIIFNQWCETWL